ncbi:hypothetical protein AAVH_17787 [Aphelenchoides avenae]|nr:hypothetical protein AAVH_17787 [Aphelenchus avenae]
MVEAKWFVDQDTQTDKDIEPNAALTGDQNAALLRAEILKLKKELDDCKAELAETKDLPTDLLSLSPEGKKERQEKALEDMSWQMQKSMMDNDQKLRDKFMARITALEAENKSMSLELRKLRGKYDEEKKRSGSLVESYSNAVKLIPKSPMCNEIPTQEYDPLDDFNLDEVCRVGNF